MRYLTDETMAASALVLLPTMPSALVDGADGVHMAAQVIAKEFKGKNRVAQQRMVYAALKGKMDGPNGELHALALTTKAKE